MCLELDKCMLLCLSALVFFLKTFFFNNWVSPIKIVQKLFHLQDFVTCIQYVRNTKGTDGPKKCNIICSGNDYLILSGFAHPKHIELNKSHPVMCTQEWKTTF